MKGDETYREWKEKEWAKSGRGGPWRESRPAPEPFEGEGFACVVVGKDMLKDEPLDIAGFVAGELEKLMKEAT